MRILLINASDDDAILVMREIQSAGHVTESERVFSAEQMREALEAREWDLLLSNHQMSSFSGIEALDLYKKAGLKAPFIVISGTKGEKVAIELMRSGASDYILKSNLSRLVPAIEREMSRTDEALRNQEEQLRRSRNLQELHRFAGRIAHEFKNHLAIIVGYTKLSLEELDDESPLRANLLEIGRATRKASELTEKLRSISHDRVSVLPPARGKHVEWS